MFDRLIGVITLKAATYRQIADDTTATGQALIVLVVATLINGFFGGLVKVDTATGAVSASVVGAILGAIGAVIFGLIAWVVAAWVLQLVAGWFGGKTNTSEMMRVTGYVEVFSIVGVLSVLAFFGTALTCVVGIVGFIAAILALIGYVIGVREAAEFSTGKAIITAIIAAIIRFLIVAVVAGAVIGAIAVALALTGAGG